MTKPPSLRDMQAQVNDIKTEMRYVSDVHRGDPCDQRIVGVLDRISRLLDDLVETLPRGWRK